MLNYTFAIVENKLSSIIKTFASSDRSPSDDRVVTHAFLAVLEFGFFAYSASPKVNHTIRLCRTISTCVDFLNSAAVSHELKHQVFKYVHDNIIHELKKNSMTPYREVESLYLLVSLSQIGKAYALPEATLARHFLVNVNETTQEYYRSEALNHFSITVLLTYIKNKVRYTKLKSFLEAHVVDKLKSKKIHCPTDAEGLLLLFDLVICPYISDATKVEIGNVFGLSWADVVSLQASNDRWFTVWGDDFDVGRELDAKRSREVY